MDENRTMVEILEKIEKNSRRQVWLGRMQCIFALAAALFCGGAFLMLWQVLPQINTVLEQVQTVLANLETSTAELSQLDLPGMITGMDTLVTTAQESLNQTMEKLNTIDFTTLNKAIDDLAAVVEPLSRLLRALS